MIEIAQIPKDQLDEAFVENLYKSIFDYERPADHFRFDLCMVAKNEKGDLIGFCLAREMSKMAVELAWGGTSKEHRGASTLIGLKKITDACLEHYGSVVFHTWNRNTRMIKLGLALGYTIIGTKLSDLDEVMLIFNKRREQ